MNCELRNAATRGDVGIGTSGNWGLASLHQLLFCLRPQDVRHAALAQPRGVERRIEPVRGQRRGRIDERERDR